MDSEPERAKLFFLELVISGRKMSGLSNIKPKGFARPRFCQDSVAKTKIVPRIGWEVYYHD